MLKRQKLLLPCNGRMSKDVSVKRERLVFTMKGRKVRIQAQMVKPIFRNRWKFSLFTDPPFSLQSLQNARLKQKTVGDLFSDRKGTRILNKEEKRKTSVNKLSEVQRFITLIPFQTGKAQKMSVVEFVQPHPSDTSYSPFWCPFRVWLKTAKVRFIKQSSSESWQYYCLLFNLSVWRLVRND